MPAAIAPPTSASASSPIITMSLRRQPSVSTAISKNSGDGLPSSTAFCLAAYSSAICKMLHESHALLCNPQFDAAIELHEFFARIPAPVHAGEWLARAFR